MTDKNNIRELVTIIIPSYNHSEFVKEAVLSALNQDYGNIELIVIDDGSSDGSRGILQDLSKKYGFLYVEQNNQGVAKTINNGIRKANGAYLSILASDDYFYTNKISLLMNQFAIFDKDTAAIFGDAVLVDKSGNSIEKEYQGRRSANFLDLYLSPKRKKLLLEKKYADYKMLIEGNFIPAMSVLIKMQKIKEVGLFPDVYAIEDYPMWLEFSKRFKIRFVDLPVAVYRQHDDNSIVRDRLKFIKEQIRILNKEFLEAVFCGALLKYVFRYLRLCLNFILYKFIIFR
ncbi:MULTISPECIES: glycosyltransferase [unclassified Polaromonas]|uniref:glycosyltransferase n=1 Tax=unclassified Polaromonas TaxID=2638319 RepID=UPI0018C9398F|nr:MULTISPECIES: glycosyltransferase [unclassified Polaromonas]MBG6070810.1 alpha-1,3-rhamnosyltransferase [Polaromonas sp. CG_9.7]MBG6112880.1 alpha-1,3-rhamnosyltransferase [Polaromonas sp. CG_9.2]